MLSSTPLLLPLLSGAATATNLWVTSYGGTVDYLNFSGNALAVTNSLVTGQKLPTWATYEPVGKTLYVSDEDFQDPQGGTLKAYSVGEGGALTLLGTGQTPRGAVATTLYGGADGKSFLATAHYHSSQITTFKLPLNGGTPQQSIAWTLSQRGPNYNRQDAPHPHQVILDPTGEYIIVPDLGSDLIHINKIDKSSGMLTECPAAKAAPGSGPRHGAFWSPSAAYSRIRRGTWTNSFSFFLTQELTNTVSAWSVSYPAGGCLTLTQKQLLTPYQGNSTISGAAVAEAHVKGNSLYISNRADFKYQGNDSISLFSISPNGTLTWLDNTSSYGTYPRTFVVNNAGTFAAIGNQASANVAIVARDPVTGKLGEHVADARVGAVGVPGTEQGISAVIWEE